MVRRYSSGLRAAPIFPSLFQEGQPGGGYDVLIQRRTVPLFLQFKLSECMVRATAKEAKQGRVTPPFYRMHLRPAGISDQHQLLLQLDAAGEEVYYVAPLFYTEVEFNLAYLSGDVLRSSFFIRPSAIGVLPDNGQHHVTFRDRNRWWVYSEPREGHEPADEESMERRLRSVVSERGAIAQTQESWRQLAEKIVALVAEPVDRPHGLAARRRREVELFRAAAVGMHPVEQVAFLSRAFLEAYCMVVWDSSAGQHRG
jgi:hypothetical protein